MLYRVYIRLIVSLLCLSPIIRLSAQEPINKNDSAKLGLSLRNIVDLAISQSSSLKYAQNQHVSYYWRYRNFG